MQVKLDLEFDIPSSTPQQRSFSTQGSNYPSLGLRYARAAWIALLMSHAPHRPLKAPCSLRVSLYYHTQNERRDGRHKVTRPDATNILKLVEDCLVKCGYLLDDSGNTVFCERKWTTGASRVVIELEEIEE